MNPKNWSVLCWGLLALWLVPFFFGSIPFNAAPVPDGVVKQLAGGTDVVVYNGWRVGWPLPFVEISRINANGAKVREYDPVIGLLNLVLVLATLAGIVVVVQTWFGQFSIRALMLSIAGLAVLIILTQAMFSGASHNLRTAILMTVYFSPLVAGIITMILKRHEDSTREIEG